MQKMKMEQLENQILVIVYDIHCLASKPGMQTASGAYRRTARTVLDAKEPAVDAKTSFFGPTAIFSVQSGRFPELKN